MAKEEVIEVEGKVVEVLPGSRFRIELENGHIILQLHIMNLHLFQQD